MRNIKINWLLSLALLPQAFIGVARGAEAVSPTQFLLEQVRLGEATNKDELVKQSLYRLNMMDPNNPDVIAAGIRQALRQGNLAEAQKQLDKLQQLAPDSDVYRRAKLMLAMTKPEVRQQLQEARLLATAGRVAEAKVKYDQLLQGNPPTLDLAVEYWRLVARLPGQEALATQKLASLDQQYPGNVALRMALARMYFSQQKAAQGYAMLEKVATDPTGTSDAADLWMDTIKTMTVSPQSVAALTHFLNVFSTGPQADMARKELANQQAMLADPTYQARLSGLAKVDSGSGAAAIPALKQALAASPYDPEILGALGLAYARAGDRAQALRLFEQAQKSDKDGLKSDKWASLIKTNRYWLLNDEGDKALKTGNTALAQQKYQQARQIDGSDSYALIGLGDVAVARHDDKTAEQHYQQALRLDPANSSAVRGLANIYQRESPQKALNYLNNLPRSQQAKMRDTLNSLQLDMLKQQAEALAAQQQWHQAAEKYRQAQKLAPDDVWITYRLAQALAQDGHSAQADAEFHQLASRKPGDPEQVYAYALYLSSTERDSQALAHLATLPAAQWNDNIRELDQRLKLDQVLTLARQLRENGDETGAITALRQQPANTQIDLTLADWALERGDYSEALAGYQRIRAREPQNPDARLGEIEAYIAEGRLSDARQHLQTEPLTGEGASLNTQRRVANAWSGVGDPQKAADIFQRLKPAAAKGAPSQDNALVFRDSARLAQSQGQPTAAQDDFKQAMVASGIAPTRPTDNDSYTLLTRNQATDDWLKRGIRADAADLYRQQDTRVTLDQDYWGSSGTGGISDLSAFNTMAQVDTPLADGRVFFRSDIIEMNASTFANTKGVYKEKFGTCYKAGCEGDIRQRASGTSIAMGWQNDHWATDIGTTPMGFEVVDVVGGLAYSNSWNHIGWTATASRRPLSSSLLAFAGTRDPNTNVTWGGVRANGVSLGASYDRGEANGVWSDLSYHYLTGQNVADNQRLRFMTGYYYKLINEDNRRLTVGLNGMWWHYQKDLSGYTLGQGGYYSPQKYLSLAIPVNYRQRTDNWSWELGGSVSLSHSATNDRARYPLQSLLNNSIKSISDRNDLDYGDSSNGVGYTLRALIERRLSSHWTLGAGVDIQQAKDYTPSHALIYLRYSMAGWQGDLDMPPQPLVPYADFK
ncbi:TPA: cellulose synthase complex outer membrane protein BcsC [Yersinia enterocolitica]|uniref:cellulose synthase complex outer membrane protein BcsC n=1 Tax=Yersinia enterocolitica TaxID=630 RepID=UPI001F58BA12|nr:cellulose synthase complex outer membrane protein BcsC [Yersinia enterocolitica]EKN3829113.1 cellulose biosynthesis protein BcsC [Yersinia enterocolitica]EKN4709164.1 cellulose biosynthesis protein BcsC [Yersinia enterocolitica]EKN4827411.1 cellulose biosynthesis protein BcsC [Yersinia enterocolitica]EKN5141788.1 cellulose biosynthesis protein BcsC [Yersinia enterocolitica]EKN6149082.1 cellulose biosynthesis protein BcsC [Yersinia enterocolitica]